MLINEFLIKIDKNGLFERDESILTKLMNMFLNSNYRYQPLHLAIDYAILFLDNQVDINNTTDEEKIKMIGNSNIYSKEFNSNLVNILINEEMHNNESRFDNEEHDFIERIKSILNIDSEYEFDVYEELLNLLIEAENILGYENNVSILER